MTAGSHAGPPAAPAPAGTGPAATGPRRPGAVAGLVVGEIGGERRRFALDDVGPPRRAVAALGTAAPAVLALPALAVIVGLLAWPVALTAWRSVTGEGGGFVGLANFREAFAIEGIEAVLSRTLLWATMAPTTITASGLLLAVAARRRGEREDAPIARLVLLPLVLPLVTVGVAFRLLFGAEPDRGPLAAVVDVAGRPLGLSDGGPVPWLGPRLVLAVMLAALLWAWIGLARFAFVAALDDAVRPGAPDPCCGGTFADAVRRAYRLARVRRAIVVVFALVAVASVRTFDLVLVMVPSGTRDDAAVLGVTLWQAIGTTTPGAIAALGVVWLAAVAVVVGGAAAWLRWVTPVPFRLPERRRRPARAAAAPAPGAARPARPTTGRGRRRWRRELTVATWAIPLVVLVATSLHAPRRAATGGFWAWPPSLASYDAVLGGTVVDSALDTAALAAAVTVVVLALGLSAAYALAWLAPPRARAGGIALLLASAVVPVHVIAGPVTEVLGAVGLAATPLGLVAVHVAFGLPFAVLVLRDEFERLNWSAAGDDTWAQRARLRATGGRDVAAWLWREARPVVVAVAALQFIQVWNDLVVALLFQPAGLVPLGTLAYGQARQFMVNAGALSAQVVLMGAVPVAVAYAARHQLLRLLDEALE